MTKTLQLNREFEELIAHLCSLDRAGQPSTAEACRELLGGWLTGHPDKQAILRRELERALSDNSYLRLHLRRLDDLGLRRLPYDLLSDERERQVLDDGLNVLMPGELGLLALHVHQLLQLWDAIEEHFPPYWSDMAGRALNQAVAETGAASRSIHNIVGSVREGLEQDREERSDRNAAPDLVMTCRRLAPAPCLEMAAEGVPADSSTPHYLTKRQRVSRYRLRDAGGRVLQLTTDREGRVFVLLPDELLRAVPRGLLVNGDTYSLTRQHDRAFEIEELGEGDLRDLADGDGVVKGEWQ